MSQVSQSRKVLSGCGGSGVVEGVYAQDRSLRERVGVYVELSKIKITRMVMVTAYIGYAFSSAVGVGRAEWWGKLCAMLIGVAMSCMAATVFNQVMEVDIDGKMRRTRGRPLPSGRISKGQAMLFGCVLAVGGVGVLWAFCNGLAAMLSAATIVSYVFVYTPLKRLNPIALLVGAVPGAMPPVIGYAAGGAGGMGSAWGVGGVGLVAWVIFGIMFVWQVPHFLALAWMYREDYARAGLPMLSVIDKDGGRTFLQILIGCLTLVPLGLLPTMIGISGVFYFAAAMICGGGFLWCGIRLVREPTEKRAKQLFLASLVYLLVVLVMMVVDKI